jgi:hypothetical protein
MRKSIFTFAVIMMALTVNYVSAQSKCPSQCSKSQASVAACSVVDKSGTAACPLGSGDCTKCPYMGKTKVNQSKMKGASVKSSMVKSNVKAAKSSQSLVAMTKTTASKNDAAIKAETPKRFKQ